MNWSHKSGENTLETCREVQMYWGAAGIFVQPLLQCGIHMRFRETCHPTGIIRNCQKAKSGDFFKNGGSSHCPVSGPFCGSISLIKIPLFCVIQYATGNGHSLVLRQ